MKHLTSIALTVALGTSACAPLGPPMAAPRATAPIVRTTPGVWRDVVALPRGTPVRVFTQMSRYEGTMLGADDTVLRLKTRTAAVIVDAANVVRVDRRQTTGSRAKEILKSTVVSTAILTVGATAIVSLACREASGNSCFVAPPATAVAATAVAFATAKTFEGGRDDWTIYVK